jgi:hypothetical protein
VLGPNYNSTKLYFVYFGFFRGRVPSKRNAWFIFYQKLGGCQAQLRDPMRFHTTPPGLKAGKPYEIPGSQLLFHHVAD